MNAKMNTEIDVANEWLQYGQTIRISGLDLKPLAHPIVSATVWCITKGQATVFFLEQVPHGKIWLLKKFTPGRRPTDEYMQAVNDCMPGGPGFYTCTQRRLLRRAHIDQRSSTYKHSALGDFIEGTILMPKVPGTTWASMADDLRDGSLVLPLSSRLSISQNLAKCIELLEAGHCSHRDLSSTNVFIAEEKVFLIDWECLYHNNLTFQPNTSLGTMGYVAPFASDRTQMIDARWSWCECADRFALAVLIAEIMLIGQDTPLTQEDGTLFSQAQIDEPGNNVVTERIDRLSQVSRPVGALLRQAFMSKRLQDCPAPRAWIAALKTTQRRRTNSRNYSKNNRSLVICGRCKEAFSMSVLKRNDLLKQNKAPLCKDCFNALQSQWARQTLQRNMERPRIICEHCERQVLMARRKLDTLRSQGKPMLCPDCLREQLETWKNEQAKHDHSRPHVICAICKKTHRTDRFKMEELQSKGKSPLCRECLKAKRPSGTQSKTVLPTRTSGTKSIFKHLAERVQKWA